jgi:hypothetical protein
MTACSAKLWSIISKTNKRKPNVRGYPFTSRPRTSSRVREDDSQKLSI